MVNPGLETPGCRICGSREVVAAGLQARIDLDEQPKPCLPPLVMVADVAVAARGSFPRLRVVKEDSETSREEAMQKALADLQADLGSRQGQQGPRMPRWSQAIRDEKIADAHREFEEDLEKAGGLWVLHLLPDCW